MIFFCADWSAHEICRLSSNGHNWSWIVYLSGEIFTSVFWAFFLCFLIRLRYRQKLFITSIGSQIHELFDPESIHAYLVPNGSRMYAIFTMKSVVAASLRSPMFSYARLMSTVCFDSMSCYWHVSNRSCASQWVPYVGLTFYLFTVSRGTVLDDPLWSLVMYCSLFWKVYIIVYVFNGSQYFFVLSLKSLKFLSFGGLLVHLLVLKST